MSGPWPLDFTGEQRKPFQMGNSRAGGLGLPCQSSSSTQETQLYLGVKQTKSNFLG